MKPSVRFRGGHVVGHAYDNPEQLAKTVLTFMVKPLMARKSYVLRFIPLLKLTSAVLYALLLQALQIIENAGGHCVAVMSDNHSANRQVHETLRKHFPLNTSVASHVTYKIVHPANQFKVLYLLFDPVHLFKSVRNNWVSEKTQTLVFFPPGKENPVTAKWTDLVSVYNKERDHSVKRTTLSERALFPSNFDKQKVGLANCVFHEKTIAALTEDGKNDTACFVYHVTRLWHILNSRNPNAHIILNDNDRRPIKSSNDSLLLYLLQICDSFTKAMTFEGRQRVQCLTKETMSSLTQTLQGLVDLARFLLEDKAQKYVLLGHFQSDCLEGEFGALRQLFGGMYLISFEQILAGEKLRRLKLFHSLNVIEEAKALGEHQMECCTVPLSEEELLLLDDAAENIHFISECERSSLYFISGYVAKKEMLRTASSETPPNCDVHDDGEFTRLVSRGKLCLPPKHIFWFSLLAYSFFCSCKMKCRSRFVKAVTILYQSLPDEAQQVFDNKEINVIRRLANTFFSGYVRKESEEKCTTGESKRKKAKLCSSTV